jgi:hypothetical protein
MNVHHPRKATNAGTEPGLQPDSNGKHFIREKDSPQSGRVVRRKNHLGQQLAAQFLAKNSQSASVSIREFQFPATELLLEDLILGHEVVRLLLQSARKLRSQPRCHELQGQRQRRTAGLVLLPAHELPSTPFPVSRECVGTLVKLRAPLRYSSILFWHRTPSVLDANLN